MATIKLFVHCAKNASFSLRLCLPPHGVRLGRWSDGYPGAGGASAVTISQGLIGMKRATQSASLQAGHPIIPTDISFRGTHAGNLSSDLHGLASLTGTCPPESCFSDAYSESSGACRERRIYIYRDILTKGSVFMRKILFLGGLLIFHDNKVALKLILNRTLWMINDTVKTKTWHLNYPYYIILIIDLNQIHGNCERAERPRMNNVLNIFHWHL